MSRQLSYCPSCGASLAKGAQFCAECGARVPSSYEPRSYEPTPASWQQPPPSPYAQPRGYGPPPYGYRMDKGLNPLLAIAIVLLPIIGLVTFFVYRNNRPRASNQSCYAAIFGMVINFILNMILFGGNMFYYF